MTITTTPQTLPIAVPDEVTYTVVEVMEYLGDAAAFEDVAANEVIRRVQKARDEDPKAFRWEISFSLVDMIAYIPPVDSDRILVRLDPSWRFPR